MSALNQVAAVGAAPAPAETVIDARHEEQARELRRARGPAHPALDALVVDDRAFGGDELIGEAVRDEDLAAAVAEAREVRVIGAVDRRPEFRRLVSRAARSRRG
jgi:hypothetical protein